MTDVARADHAIHSRSKLSPAVEVRRERGRRARKVVPHEAQAELPARLADVDPVGLLEQQAVHRVSELVPLRYGRMLESPFAFYRGAALIMADDLAMGPNTGLHAQLCGDAHASNFGLFASHERRLLFDVNDFDETLPGPFEWDLKRLAASLEVAGRDRGFSDRERRRAVVQMVKAYRKAMRGFVGMGEIDLWYARLDVLESLDELRRVMDRGALKRVERTVAKSRSRDRLQATRKQTETVDGHRRFRSDPPLLVPVAELARAELPHGSASGGEADRILGCLRAYSESLDAARRHLLAQYTVVDMARKVVGVGSVGTRAWVFLLEGAGALDPLILQAKEAQQSVLEHALERAAERGVTVGAPDESGRIDIRPEYATEGERVVAGQRVMQAVGDMLLGWQRGGLEEDGSHDYYLRQLRDWKGSFDLNLFQPDGLTIYGMRCAWILARSHARSGDRFAIDSYLQRGRGFDEALADFAVAYADRNEKDYAQLQEASVTGKVKVVGIGAA